MIHISIISTEEQKEIHMLLAAQEDFEIVSTGKSSYDVVKAAENLHPEIIIMDLYIDDIDGADLARCVASRVARQS